MSNSSFQFSYSPSSSVLALHNIPHLSESLTLMSNKFNLSDVSMNSPYGQSVVALPAVLLALGLLSLLILQLLLSMRCCCKCLKCGPSNKVASAELHNNTVRAEKTKLIKTRKAVFYLYYIFAFFVLLANLLLFYGNTGITEGTNTTADTLTFLHDMTASLKASGSDMIWVGGDINNDVSASSCPYASNVQNDIQSFLNNVYSYNQLIGSLPGVLNTAKTQVLC